MTFKTQLMEDVFKTFLNKSEFADEHIINGQSMPAIIDTSYFEDKPEVQALHNEPIAIFVPQGALTLPRPNDRVVVDTLIYRCFGVQIEQGCDVIQVERIIST